MLPQHKTHLSNLCMGTMFYMCPTVVQKAQVGPSSDVFSLGVMLWELYHGRPAGVRTAEGPRYSTVFPSFPPACLPAYRAITLHCLQRQPQNRPPATEVEECLQWLLTAQVYGAGAGLQGRASVVDPSGLPWGQPGPGR
ncbi:Mitogen-activated protein kinase kinase kinase 1 [Tetrabaena socialis]|uniref:Mitogen-activated protein kinase kinase kinase 1 n=1 Tax=Tetrabaena socialis TaxID=47790 RepID=A0A2J7ZVU5_9CHLO|nr:Mitogen-activated protein kinase kinase kinase 1 [Tetrabaena socialis]|eukprot:PNH04397.1 Mitogen-activated protein kinase kinase kinase 1 [Tetrabaena socialis]